MVVGAGKKVRRTLVLGGICALAAAAYMPVTTGVAAASGLSCGTSWQAAADGNWSTPSAWTNGVPTSSVVGCLPNLGSPYTVTVQATSAAAAGLSVGSGVTLAIQGEDDDGDALLSIGSSGVTNAGDVQLTSAGTSRHAAGMTLASGATFTNSGTLESVAGSGGARVVTGDISNGGAISAPVNTSLNGAVTNTGQFNTAGSISVASGFNLYVQSLGNFTPSTHALSGGQYFLSGTLDVPQFDVRTIDNANVQLQGSGTHFGITGGGDGLTQLASLGLFADFQVTGGTVSVGALQVGGAMVVNNAELDVAGNLTVTSNGRVSSNNASYVPSGGQVILTGGVLQGTGIVHGSLSNSGDVQPQGGPGTQLTVTGNYAQTAGGTLDEEPAGGLSGIRPLVVQQTAQLGGVVFFIPGPFPGAGQSAAMVSAAHRNGTFDAVKFGVFTDGQRALPTYTATTAGLLATPYIQDDDIRIGYEGWTSAPGLEGYIWERTSSTPGDSMTFPFTGPKVSVWVRVGPDRGEASVTVDGQAQPVLDSYGAQASEPKLVTYQGFSSGNHVIKVTVLGAHDASSTGNAVTLRDFSSVNLYDLAMSKISIGGWTNTTLAAASGGTERTASAFGHVLQVPFNGTGINWITQTCKACGKAEVWVDSGLPSTIDLYSASTINQAVEHVRSGLAPGPHTLTILVLGAKRSAATGTKVVVDAFLPLS